MSQSVTAPAVENRSYQLVDASAGVSVPYVAQQPGRPLVFQPTVMWEAEHPKHGKCFYEVIFVPSDLLARQTVAAKLIRRRMEWISETFMFMRVVGKNPHNEHDFARNHPEGHLRVIVGGISSAQRQAEAAKVKEFLNECWAEVCGQPIVYDGPDSENNCNGPGNPAMNWNGSHNNWGGTPNHWDGPPSNWNGPPQNWNGPPSNWNGPSQNWNCPPNNWNAAQNCWNWQPNNWYGPACEWQGNSWGPCYNGLSDYGQTSGGNSGCDGSMITKESGPPAVQTVVVRPPESKVTCSVLPSTQEQPPAPGTIVSAAICGSSDAIKSLEEVHHSGTENAFCKLDKSVTDCIAAVRLLSSVDLDVKDLVGLLENKPEHLEYRYLVRDALARVADVLERGEELAQICLEVKSMLILPPSHLKLPLGVDPKMLVKKTKVRRVQSALVVKLLGSGNRNPSVVDEFSPRLKENSVKSRQSDEEMEGRPAVDNEDALSVTKFLRGFGREHLDLLKLYVNREDHSIPLRY